MKQRMSIVELISENAKKLDRNKQQRILGFAEGILAYTEARHERKNEYPRSR